MPALALMSPDALSVVKAPLLAVVEPIAPGETHVDPSRVLALMVPVPVKSSVAPVPTTMAAEVLVPEVMLENATLPEDGAVHVGALSVPLDVRM